MTLKQIINRLKGRRSSRALSAVGIILLAGALIEAMSLLQYNYIHDLMEDELDYRAESEMTLKAVRVKGMLNSNERMVRNYLWAIQRQIEQPEKSYSILHRIVGTNDDVVSCFAAFVPDFYPEHKSLFEPCAIRHGDSIVIEQMAEKKHDYTKREFYNSAVLNNTPSWCDPYIDSLASGGKVTTYAMPISDKSGKTVGVFGIDLSTQCIIDTLNTKHNYPSTFFLLLTEDGRLISKPDSSHTQASDVAAVVKMINDSTYERELSSSGNSKVITFTNKEDGLGYAYYAFMKGKPHWQIVMVCYDDEIYGPLKVMRRNLMLMLLACFSLLGFILYQFNKYVRRLHQSKINQERTDSELRVAQNIQTEMLPHRDICRQDVEVSGKQISALEVGGDLYDYFIRDEKLYFCIGDVSGKGVPSSLVMAVVHSFFRSQAQRESNPANIMRVINDAAAEGNETNMFVTLFIGVLDLPTGRLRYCNAGHDAPLLIGDSVKALPVKANLPVGLFSDFNYSQQQEQLTDGTTLFLYTDGLTEANNPEHKLFGMPRVLETAQSCMQRGDIMPKQVMHSMLEAVRQFVKDADQSDDLTMLALHYRQPKENEVLHETLALINDIHQIPELNSFVKTVGDRLNLDSSLMSQLTLAVEEAVVNVMSYAYPLGTKGDITVEAKATEEWLKFIITDQGKAFDPTQGGNADTTLNAEDRPIGGLGILLVQKLMDTINYERIDGKNVLTLKKNYKLNNDKNV